MICGSTTFAQDMLDIKSELEKFRHEVKVPLGMEPHLIDPSFGDNLEENLKFCIDNDIMRANFNQIKDGDAILVFNKKKNTIEGYIGVSVLMEMAIAHFLHKKIFIMYEIPHFNNHRWAHEVSIMQPKIIKGDLFKIK